MQAASQGITQAWLTSSTNSWTVSPAHNAGVAASDGAAPPAAAAAATLTPEEVLSALGDGGRVRMLISLCCCRAGRTCALSRAPDVVAETEQQTAVPHTSVPEASASAALGRDPRSAWPRGQCGAVKKASYC